MKHPVKLALIAITSCTLLILNCGLLDIEQTPTKTKMLGLWELTAAYDDEGNRIDSKINFPITAFHLKDYNKVTSTAGPMIMRTVYGDSKYTTIAAKVDQVFNYKDLTTNDGEWFIEGGYPDRFTLEMTLGGAPGQKTITDILDLFGITKDFFDVAIYHKFLDVSIEFELLTDTVMTWKFDNKTTAIYNTKDKNGNYVLWNGISVDSFTHGKYVFRKRAGTLQSLVQNTTKKR